jgi:hypothetical protein
MIDGQLQTVQLVFNGFRFESGTGFICDLVQYPDTLNGTLNFAVRAYKSTFEQLTEQKKLLITEQISKLIVMIKDIGVNCILEVYDAPGKPSSSN